MKFWINYCSICDDAMIKLIKIVLKNIKRDYYHSPQPLGTQINNKKLMGYYNDLTGKAKWPGRLDSQDIPISVSSEKRELYFPTTIIQYGLGHYDLWIETKNNMHLKTFMKIADWLVHNQDERGGWEVFTLLKKKRAVSKYSAMTQGQAISVLVRAYIHNNEEKYHQSARKSVELMLLPVIEGGTSIYEEGDLFLEELPVSHRSTILNGWVFGIFGLWDYYSFMPGDNEVQIALEKSISSLKRYIPKFDRSYWSNYDLSGNISSPFYHQLHISLLQAMHILTGIKIFSETAQRWNLYQKNLINKSRAIFIKILEKLRHDEEIITE